MLPAYGDTVHSYTSRIITNTLEGFASRVVPSAPTAHSKTDQQMSILATAAFLLSSSPLVNVKTLIKDIDLFINNRVTDDFTRDNALISFNELLNIRINKKLTRDKREEAHKALSEILSPLTKKERVELQNVLKAPLQESAGWGKMRDIPRLRSTVFRALDSKNQTPYEVNRASQAVIQLIRILFDNKKSKGDQIEALATLEELLKIFNTRWKDHQQLAAQVANAIKVYDCEGAPLELQNILKAAERI